jgi:uncharacterized membrane protein YfcA
MDMLATVWQTPGLWWVFLGAILAGVVRGFTGFGTAMVFLPFSGAVISPVWALLSLITMDILGPLPLVLNALRKGHPRDIMLMGAGMFVTLPLGLYLLARMQGETYRYIVSIATLSCVVLLISGFRYRGVLTRPLVVATGGLGGFLGGVADVPGPPVMVLYMASCLPAEAVRANLILFLLMADLLTFPFLAMQDMLSWHPMVIGIMALQLYMAGGAVGAALFNPEKEKVYRVVAYCVIVGSAIVGLPFWTG